MAYRSRIVDASIRHALTTFGAVVIEGPRAAGKTTTALQHANSSVRLDVSPEVISLAESSPQTVLAGDTPRLIDEWQLAPSIWNAARHAVDERREPGQFILTGSATPSDDITRHSGAGRFRRIRIRTMSLAESGESTRAVPFQDLFEDSTVAGLGGPGVERHAKLIVRGGWPVLVEDPDRSASEYLSAYLEDTARADLPAAGSPIDPVRMKALIRALARNLSTEIPATRLAAEAELEGAQSMSAQSVRTYLDALTRIHVLEEQPAWQPHLRSAIRKRVSPKWHFVDPSLAASALRASAASLLDEPKTLGLMFESLAIRDLRVYADAAGGSVSHYRDEQGLEVDAIVELSDGRWAAFEIKLGGQSGIEDAVRNLRKLTDKLASSHLNRLASLNVLTAGDTSFTRPDGVNVVALGHLGSA